MAFNLITALVLLVGVLQPIPFSIRDTTVLLVEADDPRLARVDGRWHLDDAPWTGVLRERHASGVVAAETPLLDGRPHGIVREWFGNGRIESVRVFWRGRKIGRHQGWWADGAPRFTATYEDDVYQGEYRTWYEGGSPYELRHFDRGREAGLQQSWTATGDLYLNYQVRNGRRYGYVNARPCLPVTEGRP